MQSKNGFRTLLLIVVLAVACWDSEARAETATFEQSFTIDGSLLLDVKTDSGSIDISTGPVGMAEVVGHARVTQGLLRRSPAKADELMQRFEASPPVRFDDGELSVGHKLDREMSRYLTISYEIVVPADTEVHSSSDSGSQSILGVSGPARVDADSGSVTLKGVGGPVQVSVDSGDIDLTDIGEAVVARSDSGSIVANGVAGAFEAHADSGEIMLVQVAPGDVQVSTDSGSIELRGIAGGVDAESDSGSITIEGRQEGAWRIESESGSVRVSLPADAAFSFDAETDSSRITIDHPVVLEGSISKDSVTGNVRGGGSLLKIRTDSGSIRVR